MKKPSVPSPAEQMLQMATGYWLSQCLSVAAELGIADLLRDSRKTAAQLAARTKTKADRLHRVLRALAGCGVLRIDSQGRYSLTRLGRTLRSDVPDSQRDFVRMITAGYNYVPWSNLIEGVRDHVTPFDRQRGEPIFAYLQEHPEDEAIFARSMAAISRMENGAIAAAYDFTSLGTLADIGGSQGHLLGAILAKHKRLKGILFDQPAVVAGVAKAGFLREALRVKRCSVVGGSFFESVPAGAGGYLMKYIIHDWDDERSLAILRNVRAAMAPSSKLLLAEHVVGDDNRPGFDKMLDINMLVLTGGMERTAKQYTALLKAAGLKLKRIHPTAGRISLIEAVPA